jgi:hypothetical protein
MSYLKKLLLTAMMISIIITANKSSNIQNTELDCNKYANYKYLQISTNMNENSQDFNIHIMNNCEVSKRWIVREDNDRMCLISERVYEGEDNIRRAFRFTYRPEKSVKENLEIKNINLIYPKSVAETRISKNNITLRPGESYDIYIDYDCWNMNMDKRSDWYKIKFVLEFEEGIKEFEYFKICEANYDGFDISQIIIICIIFLIIYASVKDYLQSKLEAIIVEKYSEIKNPENLFIITCVVFLILIFLHVIGVYHDFTEYVIFIVAPLSIAMIAEAGLKNNRLTNPESSDNVNWITNLEHMTYEIPLFGSVTMYFVVCLAIGLLSLLIWIYTHNWLVNNIISIAISIVFIRIFKFTSLKFILIIYILAIAYECVWINYYSSYSGENSKLTNLSSGLPVKILCPELTSSPFNACNSLPIADIILPGIFLTYSRKYDEIKYGSMFFNIGVISLGIGLIINIIVYYTISLPTPSFFYTGPIMLIITLLIAYKREELYDFIEGFRSTSYENKSKDNFENFVNDARRRADSRELYRPPADMGYEMKQVDLN